MFKYKQLFWLEDFLSLTEVDCLQIPHKLETSSEMTYLLTDIVLFAVVDLYAKWYLYIWKTLSP